MDAISDVALAGKRHTEEHAACTHANVEAGAMCMGWYVAERTLDATPINVSFGKSRAC